MSKTARTIYAYSFYLFLMGASLFSIPNVILPLLGFNTTSEVWIRVLGLFTFVAGIYYLVSSLNEQKEFFKATVAGRILFFIGIVFIVVIFQQPSILLAVGSIDLLGAAFTLYYLRQEKRD